MFELGWGHEDLGVGKGECGCSRGTLQPAMGHGTERGKSSVEMPVTRGKDETWVMCSIESQRKLCFLLSRAR